MEFGGGRKRGRPALNGNGGAGGFKKSKQGVEADRKWIKRGG